MHANVVVNNDADNLKRMVRKITAKHKTISKIDYIYGIHFKRLKGEYHGEKTQCLYL